MIQKRIWVCLVSSILLINAASSEVEVDVRNSLISFLAKLNGSTGDPDPSFGWSNATDPCKGSWKGVTCDVQSNSSVTDIVLDNSGLHGVFYASLLCTVEAIATSLARIKITGNNIGGQLTNDIANCKNLTHLLIGHNQFSGSLPDTLPSLVNLKKLHISYNDFSGDLPDLAKISGLIEFLAEYNQLTGGIPQFHFANFLRFNLSYNNLEGPVPDSTYQITESSFLGNPGLCGSLVQRPCPVIENKKIKSIDHALMYSGYALMALVVIAAFGLYKRKKLQKKRESAKNDKMASSGDTKTQPRCAAAKSEYKSGTSVSEVSVNSAESGLVSTSLIVLTSPVVNGLKFDDLLRAPAELLGRGKHGSLYKVLFENRIYLTVKRIKDWSLSNGEFKIRMQKIYEANHPNVLPPLAFYSSKQEKLLVYEYQQNGSLFNLLHGTKMSQMLDWPSRLTIATKIAEALAFMHHELSQQRIAHGNLKSTNIIFNKSMEPCLSEYGLMFVDNQYSSNANTSNSPLNVFQADVYSFGVILLELLTGKHVQTNGVNLTSWVHSVVKEEWTVEVFDKSLISEGASEERMVNLLQVAIKCVKSSLDGKLTMKHIWQMINTIKEEEGRSQVYDEKSVVSQ